MSVTSIEWTDETWNPVVGCTRVSPGCEHCYAETMAARQVLMSEAQGRRSVYLRVVDAQRRRWTREVELLPERLQDPLGYKPGTLVFVVSMGDPFHDGVPFEFLEQMWAVMAASPRVTFQVLTKRPGRMVEFLGWLRERAVWNVEWVDVGGRRLPGPALWPEVLPNVWLGVSVEDQQRADERIPSLLQAPAAVRFLSIEPLLGPLDLGKWLGNYDCHACGARFWADEMNIHQTVDVVTVDCEQDPDYPDDEERTRHVCPRCGQADLGTGDVGPACGSDYEDEPTIDWTIVGGESGPKARPIEEDWVRSLLEQCKAAEQIDAGRKVAFFFKQWGGPNKKRAGRKLDGRTHDAMPEVRRG